MEGTYIFRERIITLPVQKEQNKAGYRARNGDLTPAGSFGGTDVPKDDRVADSLLLLL